ncbi:MAG: apolipoprotein N-acyltransferase [Pyrinomonadaceae bacterium]
MKVPRLRYFLPSWKNVLLATASAGLLILSFPDFELWYLAWFALMPLMWAVARESPSTAKAFVLGWIFGITFFFGACWWLTYAPITYAGFPPVLAYLLLFCVTAVVGLWPAIFAGSLSVLIRRYGAAAILAAPFVWTATEFGRFWTAGNSWNAIGYSQAFQGEVLGLAGFGGVYLVSFAVVTFSAFLLWSNLLLIFAPDKRRVAIVIAAFWILFSIVTTYRLPSQHPTPTTDARPGPKVVAVQPNVPMADLNFQKWQDLRKRQTEMAEVEIRKITQYSDGPITVILPESPMNFMYDEDQEFQSFINGFARRNNVSVLFNSAEPDAANKKYFNSAVLVGPEGIELGQYDKIYLLPFGEAVPGPLQSVVPAFVGSFSFGKEYDLLPLGDHRAGVMICFESHFADLSRRYVTDGADVLIEMTNDGYLGPTPVLRQHLANAVFRAVETSRPVLRVTNVGITAYIDERGNVREPAAPYTEDTRVWTVVASDQSRTFYVRYGDWFAWVCTVTTILLLVFGLRRQRLNVPAEAIR